MTPAWMPISANMINSSSALAMWMTRILSLVFSAGFPMAVVSSKVPRLPMRRRPCSAGHILLIRQQLTSLTSVSTTCILHAYSPEANNLTDIPGQFGIQDIPQDTLNGGLPAFGINGLQTLGSNAFLPSDEVSSTFQATDDFTKIYGKHTFKAGFEYQHVKFSTLQPPWSRGEFDYNGDYTDVVNSNNGNTGRAAFLLIPQLATVPGGVNYLGGSTNVFVSNISLTDNGKNYYGGYVNDD